MYKEEMKQIERKDEARDCLNCQPERGAQFCMARYWYSIHCVAASAEEKAAGLWDQEEDLQGLSPLGSQTTVQTPSRYLQKEAKEELHHWRSSREREGLTPPRSHIASNTLPETCSWFWECSVARPSDFDRAKGPESTLKAQIYQPERRSKQAHLRSLRTRMPLQSLRWPQDQARTQPPWSLKMPHVQFAPCARYLSVPGLTCRQWARREWHDQHDSLGRQSLCGCLFHQFPANMLHTQLNLRQGSVHLQSPKRMRSLKHGWLNHERKTALRFEHMPTHPKKMLVGRLC